MIKITRPELQDWINYIHYISGISLDESKDYLFETRFYSFLEEQKCRSFQELLICVQSDKTETLRQKVIDLITTQETSFFRDQIPFDTIFETILPHIIKKESPSQINILSAGCSTGQEAYSLAILFKQFFSLGQMPKIHITGIDISSQAVRKATDGIYSKNEIERGLNSTNIMRYFSLNGENWTVREEIKQMTNFKKLNLMNDLHSLGKFDFIFCRNVAIYFSEEDKKKVFSNLSKILKPHGYLFVGSTETISGLCPQFTPTRQEKSVYYQLNKEHKL